MKIKHLIIGFAVLIGSKFSAQNAYNMKVENDMLSFATADDYKKVIGGLEKEEKLKFLETLKTNFEFNSLSKNPKSELGKKINSDFFELLINKDGYIKIGSNVFKVDPFSEEVAVIESSKFTGELKQQLDARNYKSVNAYSMHDDVLALVESNTPPTNARLFCGESGAGADEKGGNIQCTNPNNGAACNWMDCWVIYNRFGVYFELKAKCINRSPCREMVWHKTPAGFKVKCGYTNGPQYQWDIRTNAVGSSSWTWNEYFYQGIQPLNAYWLRVVFMAKDPSWIGNPDNPSVDLEIRRNM